MDLRAGVDGIARDVGELLDHPVMTAVALLTLALPMASLLLVALRRWIAAVPLAISVGLFAAWFLYYAADWWANPGAGAWVPGFLLVLVGWAFVVGAALRRTR